jgi:hypothetical protein
LQFLISVDFFGGGHLFWVAATVLLGWLLAQPENWSEGVDLQQPETAVAFAPFAREVPL